MKVLPTSGSVADNAPTGVVAARFSATVALVNAMSVGGSGRSATVMVPVSSRNRPPGVGPPDPNVVAADVEGPAVCNWLPTMVKEPLSSSPSPAAIVKVWVSPASGSDAVKVPTTVPAGSSSSIVALESARLEGTSLALVIVIVNAFSTPRPPWSVARTRTV